MKSIVKNELFWLALIFGGLAGAGYATRTHWLPLVTNVTTEDRANEDADSGDKSDGHKGHGSHGEETESVELSEQARRSIGLKLIEVALGEYQRTMTVPALVVERPGRSQVHINTPLTGIVTKIYPLEGEAVEPGQPLFDLQLTHEDLVSAQRDFLQSAEELDVLNREIERLESVGEGVIAGRRILERKYEQQKLKAAMRAQRQALLLHELTAEQIDTILETRELLKGLTVRVPPFLNDEEYPGAVHRFHVQSLKVYPGQHIEAGQNLCVLADHCALYIEGQAFEEDAERLQKAIRESRTVSALIRKADGESGSKFEEISDLRMLRVADRVDMESRALKFYVLLPNELVLMRAGDDLRGTKEQDEAHQDTPLPKYIGWRHKPGQRIDVLVPIERWEGRLVLPVDAVAVEGAESYVFRENGDRFERVPVHVEFRGQREMVIKNDGQLFPGDRIAGNNAYRLQVELKNKAGGAVDPHAGHGH